MPKKTPLLSDFAHSRNGKRSAVDALPEDIQAQLIDAKLSGSHYVTEMVQWLHSPEFEGEYDHITIPMLTNWFLRRGYRAQI